MDYKELATEQELSKMSELEKYEYFLKDEKERLERTEDEYLTGLLANRIKMFERIIGELKQPLTDPQGGA